MSYKFAQFVAATTFTKLFLLLVFSLSLVVAGGASFMITGEQENWRRALFKSYTLLNNAPGTSAVDEESFKGALLANIIYVTGMFTFAVVLGVVSSSITVALETALEGNHKVVEKGHVLVLNWGDKTLPMLRQFEYAAKEGRHTAPIVVLAKKSGAEMREQVNSIARRNKVQIIAREGDPNIISDLEKVSAGDASHVILLPSDDSENEGTNHHDDLTTQAACVRGLQRERQPERAVGGGPNDIHVIAMEATQKTPSRTQTSKSRDIVDCTVVPENTFVQRVVVMTAFQPGLSDVYSELLSQGHGCELYVRKVTPDQWSHLIGKKFSTLGSYFTAAVPMGVVDSEGEVEMNPPADTLLEEGQSLVLLSQDHKIRCSKKPNKHWSEALEKKSQVKHSTVRTHRPKVLVLGADGRDMTPLQYLDDVLPQGSQVTLMSNSDSRGLLDKASLLKNNFRVKYGSDLSISDLEACRVNDYDTIVLLDSEDDGEKGDSRNLAAIEMIMRLKSESVNFKKVHVVAAIEQPTFEPLFRRVCEAAGEKVTCDVVLSHEMESGALVQVLWDPPLKKVYEDLLDSDGGEMVLVDATKLLEPNKPVSFGAISGLIQKQGAVAMGWIRSDGTATLSPRKDERISVTEGDRLIVFADAF